MQKQPSINEQQSLEKLTDFREAHEARRRALVSHSPAQLEEVAKMYDKLGCPINAAAIREIAFYERAPRYDLVGVG